MTAPTLSSTSGAELLRGVLEQFSENFLLNEPGGNDRSTSWPKGERPRVAGREPRRRSDEPERVHQSRVAVRRLRSLLRSFDFQFDPSWARGLRDELGWFGELLGESRDLDVLRSVLAEANSVDLPADNRAEVLARLDESLRRARGRVDEARASQRYRDLVSALETVGDTAVVRDLADVQTGLDEALARSWTEVRDAGRRARRDPSARRLHQLRISLKRLQYLGEIAAVVDGPPARDLAQRAERLQTRLGHGHDASVALEWLRSMMVAEPTLRYALAELVTTQQIARREAHRGWRRRLRALERHWRRWRDPRHYSRRKSSR